MLRHILKYGFIAGIVVGIHLVAISVGLEGHMMGAWGMAIGYLVMLIALTAVFVGVKRHRDVDRGGVIGFWPALGMGIAISVVAGILYVLAWEVSQAFTSGDFITAYADAMIAERRAAGASAAEIVRLTAEMQAFAVQYANPLFRLPMTFAEIFPVGVLVSLVTAALVRNPRFMPARAA
jgi:Protein of unknown function (DUF4199)